MEAETPSSSLFDVLQSIAEIKWPPRHLLGNTSFAITESAAIIDYSEAKKGHFRRATWRISIAARHERALKRFGPMDIEPISRSDARLLPEGTVHIRGA
jgi:hypothetical protein